MICKCCKREHDPLNTHKITDGEGGMVDPILHACKAIWDDHGVTDPGGLALLRDHREKLDFDSLCHTCLQCITENVKEVRQAFEIFGCPHSHSLLGCAIAMQRRMNDMLDGNGKELHHYVLELIEEFCGGEHDRYNDTSKRLNSWAAVDIVKASRDIFGGLNN